MDGGQASRTAVLVCQFRAAADGRVAPGLFADPVAAELLTGPERAVVDQVRAGAQPAKLGDRLAYELVQAGTEVIVPRTVAIDRAIVESVADQLVILGAGLDARAWRLDGLAGTDVVEVDHPASQADKRQRLGDRAPLARSVRFAGIDFTTGSLDAALGSAGHDPARPTTWVWEGVVAYLRPAEVTRTLAVVSGRSAAGSRLVVNYEQANWASRAGRLTLVTLHRLARGEHPMANEPRRSSYSAASMGEALAAHGWRVADDRNLVEIGAALAIPLTRRRHLEGSRVAVADR